MSAARERLAWWGNVAVGVLLCVLAVVLLRWQNEPLAWPRPGAERWAWALGLALAYVAWVAGSAWRRARRRAAPLAPAAPPGAPPPVWVVHASQTGHAEALAFQTAQALRAGGVPVVEVPLSALDFKTLAQEQRVLFIASTTGEGDAPDTAAGFVRGVMATAPSLAHVEYAVLALGDSDYANYCAFGRELDHWLQHHGARALFDRVEVDNGDAGALRHWQHHLRGLADHADLPDWETPRYGAWTLRARRLLNPGSAGEPCFHLELTPPPGEAAAWQAGDIAEVGPRHARADVDAYLAQCGLDGATSVRHGDVDQPLHDCLAACALPPVLAGQAPQALADTLQRLPHREYSIASLPADGAAHLLVRRMPLPDGRAGLGSGWLTEHAALGERIDLRIRRNTSFHPPQDDRPVILVGNGTGLAGLRALIKARIALGHRRNWLVFGERNAAFDRLHGDELDAWKAQGWLERLDLVYSRDLPQRVYVQDHLRAHAAAVREWLAQGAAVYVCGSLAGMAPGVDAALVEAVGADALEQLAEAGRYRRDVY